MYKVSVIGDRESTLGFKALGFDTFAIENADEARGTLHRLAKDNYAIIYITEQLATQISEDIAEYKDSVSPAIILIHVKEGSIGIEIARRELEEDDRLPGSIAR